MLNKSRKRIYEICPELGKKADELVLKRKTSFISARPKAFLGKEIEQGSRKAKIEQCLSEATTMEQTYGTVTIKQAGGTEVTTSVSAYRKMKAEEEQNDNRSKNTTKLGASHGSRSSSSSSSSSQTISAKKRERRGEEKEKKA